MVTDETPRQCPPPLTVSVWDKAQHAGAFVALAVLGLGAFPRRPVAVMGALLVYGMIIELAQGAAGWRYGDWQDWLADAVGVVMGFIVWRLVR